MLYLTELTSLVLMVLISIINGAIAQSNNCALLVLDPPELVVQYGDPVSVSCHSLTNSDNLSWRVSQEDVLSSDKQNVTWETENLTDWEIEPVCSMMVAGVQCAKSLPVIVYKLPDQVSISVVNHTGPLIGGKKYDLQCDIQNFAPVHVLAVFWYKGGEPVKNRGFGNFTTKTPSNQIVTLRISVGKDEENVQYSCAAKLKLGLLSFPMVESNLLQISVHNAPIFNCPATYEGKENDIFKDECLAKASPEAKITWEKDGKMVNSLHKLTRGDSGSYVIKAVNQHGSAQHNLTVNVLYAPKIEPDKEVVKVKKGSKVFLSCTAEGNPEPELNWSIQSQIKATGRQQTTLTIVSLADAGVYTCTATNFLGNDTRKVSLIVEGENPIKIQPDELVVEFGALASANCSINTTHHGMGWEASQGGIESVDNVQSLTWKVESLTHWDIKPICYVNTDKQWQLELQVTVYKRPDLVSISTVNHTGPMIEGRQYELQCDFQNVAPVHLLNVNWYKEKQLVHSDSFTDETKTLVNKTMTLQVSTQRGDDGVQYRCEAELKLGPKGPQPPPRVTSDPLNITVHYEPVISCSAWSPIINTSLKSYIYNLSGNPIPNITWYRDEAQLSFDMRLGRNDSGQYTFVASNAIGKSSCTTNITVEYTPIFECPKEYEGRENYISLSDCLVMASPKASVTFKKDGNTVNAVHNFTRNDTGLYVLTAMNKHGTAQHNLTVNVLYAPEIEPDKEVLKVKEGSKVSLSCTAKGNPEPELNWSIQSQIKATGRQQTTLTIVKVSLADAGVYTCTATNSLGNNTREVSLIVEG
ncbi:intercellular adhesion molecule 5 precursor [Silurus asotus]|uniref:Intercellular adhesion molecule 5 n=1 Tax=Silurus asotus TaxID=30991 RepID=A0AAD5FLH4_SILAS|nr:intercellular adhesion molecule 5 precursor [Silurus asotus]